MGTITLPKPGKYTVKVGYQNSFDKQMYWSKEYPITILSPPIPPPLPPVEQPPTINISEQINFGGIIKVGGTFQNADQITIDCVNRSNGKEIRNQQCQNS